MFPAPTNAPLALVSAPGSLAEQDWVSVGLVLSILGSFLLANSILFRHPRQLVEEHFGKKPARLRPVREYIFHRVQVNLGFLFLLTGFGLQLYGRLAPPPAAPREFPTAWVGLAILAAVLLLAAGWWWSQRLFRSYVRQYMLAHPPDFETDPRFAREVGELFGVDTAGLDTVQSLAKRLRERIGLPDPDRSRTSRLDSEGGRGEERDGGDRDVIAPARRARAR